MCGICGLVGVQSHPFRADLVQRMCRQIVHRGPDDEGTFVGEGVALGIRRLSIIDVDGGAQPIFNEDRSVCVVQNGEIYNFQELRTQLERLGHEFATRSDTEVLVHLYEQYGLSFVERVNGMFAIALWDARQRRLVLLRDRLGVKPLFYSVIGDTLVFGSEIKCILEDDRVACRMDPQAVYDYFTLGYVPQPRSIYADIRKLPPAGRLVAEGGRVTIDRYWRIPQHVDTKLNKDECGARLRELLTDAVRLRMISDVPLGAFLSGGIDSSITVAVMAQQSGAPVRTFFIDFDEAGYSERTYARAVAERYGTQHHELTVKPSALEILDDLVYHFDEPFGDSSAIPTYYVSQLTRQHVTVALAGDGGDESFGGYNRYRVILRRRDMPLVRKAIGPPAIALQRVLPRRAPARCYLQTLGMPNWNYYVTGSQEREARAMLAPDFLRAVEQSVLSDLGENVPANGSCADPLAPYSQFDLRWYLPDDILCKVDRASMAHSLEVRAPFLDYRVIELAAQMPAAWKIQGRRTKLILKEIFASDLPPIVLEPRKRGFSVPLREWLRGELRGALEEVVHDRHLAQSGIFRMKEIQGLAREHLTGARDRKSQLWRVLFFARWWHAHRSRLQSGTGERNGP